MVADNPNVKPPNICTNVKEILKIGITTIPVTTKNKGDNMVNLGDEVKDRVSGFKGIAVSRHSYLQGCDRISIQPPIDKDGKHPESHGFDEPQLKVIKKAKIKRQAVLSNPGGPEKYLDTQKEV